MLGLFHTIKRPSNILSPPWIRCWGESSNQTCLLLQPPLLSFCKGIDALHSQPYRHVQVSQLTKEAPSFCSGAVPTTHLVRLGGPKLSPLKVSLPISCCPGQYPGNKFCVWWALHLVPLQGKAKCCAQIQLALTQVWGAYCQKVINIVNAPFHSLGPQHPIESI